MDIIESIKNKYDDEIGLSLNFFEIISFLLLLISSYLLFTKEESGVWSQLWNKSITDLFIGSDSLIQSSRVVDYLVAAILVSLLSTAHRKVTLFSFKLYPKEKLNNYIAKLIKTYSEELVENNAMRLYRANEAKSQKDILMKKFRSIKSSSLLFITMLFTSIIGLNGGFVEYIVVLFSIIGFVIIQIKVIVFYIRDITPLLVAEKVYSGDNVEFGDEV